MGFNGAVCINFSTVNPYAQEDFMLITVTGDWSDPEVAWTDIKAGSDFADIDWWLSDGNDLYYRTFVISPVSEDGKTRMSSMLFVAYSGNGGCEPSWTPPDVWVLDTGFPGDEYPQDEDTVQVYQGLSFKVPVANPAP